MFKTKIENLSKEIKILIKNTITKLKLSGWAQIREKESREKESVNLKIEQKKIPNVNNKLKKESQREPH